MVDDKLRNMAVGLAKKGFTVFPLIANDNRPTGKGWQERASKDPDEVLKMWSSEKGPEAFNIGVRCGVEFADTGRFLTVIDIDKKNGVDGDIALARMVDRFGALPGTLRINTPSGGYHLYLLTDTPVSSPVGTFGLLDNEKGRKSGIDVRSSRTYVVGPGSVRGGGVYSAWSGGKEVLGAPAWITERLRRVRQKADTLDYDPLDFPDHELDVARAEEFLMQYPGAVEGEGGNAHTFECACILRDFGISKEKAVDLMFGEWNERCSPPWSFEELEDTTSNAYSYAGNAPATQSLGHLINDTSPIGPALQEYVDMGEETKEFIEQEKREKEETAEKLEEEAPIRAKWPTPAINLRSKALPPRDWIIMGRCLRRNVTTMVAPAGTGKSSFTILMALSTITGRQLIHDKVVVQGPVWLYNAEDDRDELEKRVRALMILHDISEEDLMDENGEPMLHIDCGVESRMQIASRSQTGKIVKKDAKEVAEAIKERGIVLFIGDPFVEMHDASENDNGEISAVGRMFRDDVAKKANCGVIMVHHTRKDAVSSGRSASIDLSRGASALAGVARIGLNMFKMTDSEAAEYGIPAKDQFRYSRLDESKANLHLMGGKPQWYYSESVGIRCDVDGPEGWESRDVQMDSETLEYFVMEEVGALRAVDLGASKNNRSEEICEALFTYAMANDSKKLTMANIHAVMRSIDGMSAADGTPILSRDRLNELLMAAMSSNYHNGDYMMSLKDSGKLRWIELEKLPCSDS